MKCNFYEDVTHKTKKIDSTYSWTD